MARAPASDIVQNIRAALSNRGLSMDALSGSLNPKGTVSSYVISNMMNDRADDFVRMYLDDVASFLSIPAHVLWVPQYSGGRSSGHRPVDANWSDPKVIAEGNDHYVRWVNRVGACWGYCWRQGVFANHAIKDRFRDAVAGCFPVPAWSLNDGSFILLLLYGQVEKIAGFLLDLNRKYLTTGCDGVCSFVDLVPVAALADLRLIHYRCFLLAGIQTWRPKGMSVDGLTVRGHSCPVHHMNTTALEFLFPPRRMFMSRLESPEYRLHASVKSEWMDILVRHRRELTALFRSLAQDKTAGRKHKKNEMDASGGDERRAISELNDFMQRLTQINGRWPNQGAMVRTFDEAMRLVHDSASRSQWINDSDLTPLERSILFDFWRVGVVKKSEIVEHVRSCHPNIAERTIENALKKLIEKQLCRRNPGGVYDF